MFGLWDLSEDYARAPLTKKQSEILVHGVPYRRRLSAGARRRLETLTRTFLAEKSFEGCEGLAVDDEMRVTIAAQACVLLLGLKVPCYPGLRSVLIYPGAYKAQCRVRDSTGVVVEGVQGRSGESWRGLVVLAWDVVRRGPEETIHRQNLVLHEFAHHFAEESGAADGIPRMRDRRRDAVWRRTLTAAHARLVEDLEAGLPVFLRPYAATNTHEFFAVLTEAFFEKPEALQSEHPELYGLLRDFYCQDPAKTPAV
jgi:Mlc titration factor MtfA (ptsG expression regulator)